MDKKLGSYWQQGGGRKVRAFLWKQTLALDIRFLSIRWPWNCELVSLKVIESGTIWYGTITYSTSIIPIV